MQHFTIKDIENLTGIKAHSLRIWEQRYGFFKAKRKTSKHRVYDNEDLKYLLHVSQLYHGGWKISKIAAMSPDQILDIMNSVVIGESGYNHLINKLIEASIDFDEFGFVSTLQSVIDIKGFETCVLEVCYPYLQRIGHLWSTNRAIPAQEHFSSYIIQNRIIYETELLPAPVEKAPVILLVSPKGEFHELPLLFINYLLRRNGWRTIFLGKNGDLDVIEQIIREKSPSHIYLHLITNFTGFDVDTYLELFCRRFRQQKIIASGTGIQSAQRSFVNLAVMRTDDQLRKFIASTNHFGNT